jgi:hypothetical protein
MKSFIFTYPGFQALPPGIKQLLVASESDFFNGARLALVSHAPRRMATLQTVNRSAGSAKGGHVETVNRAWKN